MAASTGRRLGSRKLRIPPIEVALDPELAAKHAKLRHVDDTGPGIARHKARNGFDYHLPDGKLVRDIDTLKRIRSLAIPPAWTDVWSLRRSERSLASHGSGRARPQAVPLSPALAGGPGRSQIQQAPD